MKTIRQILTSDEFTEYQADPANHYYKINIQQINKSPVVMDCLRAPPGFKFVQADYSSLEPTVIAEYSGCPKYRELFASGKPHRVYLYVMCQLLDPAGEISKVYNPANPTKESVKAAKKQFKKQDTIGKVLHLSATYKAGAANIHRQLRLAKVDITRPEVEDLKERYWGEDLFIEVLNFEESLHAERAQRDGWIMNGLSRPLAVIDKKTKDILNSFAQSTGHDILDVMIMELEKRLHAAGILAKPCVSDFHDETVWLVPEEHAETVAELIRTAVAVVNEMINFEIELKAEPEITDTFTEFKNPDPTPELWYENGTHR